MLLSSSSIDSSPSTSQVSSENLELLSERGRLAVLRLIEHDVDGSQRHVYGGWPEPGTEDDGKRALADQVRSMVAVIMIHCSAVFL
jgi:hypothetical protein